MHFATTLTCETVAILSCCPVLAEAGDAKNNSHLSLGIPYSREVFLQQLET